VTKVCAILCFFDESPLWLAACVASLAGDVDHLVAVDGAYSLFPNATGGSPVGQHHAIAEAAAASRIPLTLHVPAEPWAGNEVEKRNASLAIARTVAAVDRTWWLLVVDADMVVARSTGVRAALAGTDRDVAAYGLVTRLDPHASRATAQAAHDSLWHKATVERPRLLYRADPSLRYEGAHDVVRTDSGYLRGRGAVLAPAADVSDALLLEHRTEERDLERRRDAAAYYRRRDELGVEQLREGRNADAGRAPALALATGAAA
jgi:hypothetical protein